MCIILMLSIPISHSFAHPPSSSLVLLSFYFYLYTFFFWCVLPQQSLSSCNEDDDGNNDDDDRMYIWTWAVTMVSLLFHFHHHSFSIWTKEAGWKYLLLCLLHSLFFFTRYSLLLYSQCRLILCRSINVSYHSQKLFVEMRENCILHDTRLIFLCSLSVFPP